jgi:hypothetical protein
LEENRLVRQAIAAFPALLAFGADWAIKALNRRLRGAGLGRSSEDLWREMRIGFKLSDRGYRLKLDENHAAG